MNHIIALKGRQGSGKTETINILAHQIFPQGRVNGRHSNFLVQSEVPIGERDFRAIYNYNGQTIGVTSVGDSYDLVHDNLLALIEAGCTICICACHTRDNGESPHGTNTAIGEFDPPFQIQFVPKTVEERDEQQLATNQSDAVRLYQTLTDVL